MTDKLRIKVVSKNGIVGFQLYDLPQQFPHVEFVTEIEARAYDWLVVYDDLPPKGTERLSVNFEDLACPQENTVLITYEPASVKHFGSDYVDQFGMVLTSHEISELPHRNRHNMAPVGKWYYGELSHMLAHPKPPKKTEQISMFGSKKRQKHTLHRVRFDYMERVAALLGDDIDIFGKDFQPVRHKAEGMDAYRYHLAVENHIGPYHWTEKLSDCFLAYSLPFYVGCTRYMDHFPEESVIPLDIRDPEGAVETIRKAIADNEYEKRLDAIVEARRLVVEDYNLGNMLARHITRETVAHDIELPAGGRIYSRHAMMRRSFGHFLRYASDKFAARKRNRQFWKDYMREPAGSPVRRR